MAITETDICNMSLGKLGSVRITSIATSDLSIEAVRCRNHYDQTRDALLRSFEWNFAKWRAELGLADTPPFEWDYKYTLPTDFLRLISVYEWADTDAVDDRFTIEGNFILTNYDSMNIKYIRKVTDPNKFDPLFVEVLVLQLALKLLHPIAGAKAATLKDGIMQELGIYLSQARTINRQEVNVTGRSDWFNSRYEGTS